MNITDAAYATVHDYPGGSEALAGRMGMSAAVLRNKVNPNNTTHHLSLAEAQRLVGLTGDKRILHALAMESGDLLIEGAMDEGPSSDMAILEAMAALMSRSGELGGAIHHAFSDGALTEDEMLRIEGVAYAVRKKVVRLMRRLRGMVEPGKRTDGA
ncbi:phage regulatory CII family protein [Luteimonas fraxinea]|uniref:Phage regulatory CII family protein n=1 Tax=Luteimonas fraxinea TaxID=2901869 RepID=A0ABS8UC26_9GAMM|nr:phage regulatory CII family protein [Luteimonas fraxinea]MCD9097065.1 phage regulatory CII family protein [Luteimonas fraxinea]